MTRKKVTLAYIANDSERKASFKKRKKGLIKKVSELSTLCGVEACAIVYSQYDSEPEVWPSLLGAQAVLARFRKLSEMDQSRKMVNQESFTRQRIKKVEDQLRRLRKDNKRRELENFMYESLAGMKTLEEFNIRDVAEMGWVVTQTLQDLKSKMEGMKLTETPPPAGSAPPLSPQVVQPEVAVEETAMTPLLMSDDLDGFPWNLVQSPGAGGDGFVDGGLGWDDGMILPYPYIFNHGDNSATIQPGSGGN